MDFSAGSRFWFDLKRPSRERLLRVVGLELFLLDLVIGLGRKIGGFCALLTLGWIYARLLVLGDSLHQIYPGAPDPDLRQTMWVALLLIMAQGWDISTDRLAGDWARLHAHLPAPPTGIRRGPGAQAAGAVVRAWRVVEPVVVRLGRVMDVCVAIANKLGALAVLGYLLFLLEQFAVAGATLRQMYPQAADPWVSFLANLCTYVIVLGWWAMPFDQIALFWSRLREPVKRQSAPG